MRVLSIEGVDSSLSNEDAVNLGRAAVKQDNEFAPGWAALVASNGYKVDAHVLGEENWVTSSSSGYVCKKQILADPYEPLYGHFDHVREIPCHSLWIVPNIIHCHMLMVRTRKHVAAVHNTPLGPGSQLAAAMKATIDSHPERNLFLAKQSSDPLKYYSGKRDVHVTLFEKEAGCRYSGRHFDAMIKDPTSGFLQCPEAFVIVQKPCPDFYNAFQESEYDRWHAVYHEKRNRFYAVHGNQQYEVPMVMDIERTLRVYILQLSHLVEQQDRINTQSRFKWIGCLFSRSHQRSLVQRRQRLQAAEELLSAYQSGEEVLSFDDPVVLARLTERGSPLARVISAGNLTVAARNAPSV